MILPLLMGSPGRTSSPKRNNLCLKMKTDSERSHFVIIWSTRDREVFRELIYPYLLNSKTKGWWQSATLVVWGPSDLTLIENLDIQDNIEELMVAGIKVEACLACADNYGIADKMKDLGIDVKYMGNPTTGYLKSGAHILTF